MVRQGIRPLPAADEAAVDAAEAVDSPRVERVQLENGIVLRLKQVPPYALGDAVRRVPVPEVPIVPIESKGIEEANPNDPDYIEAMVRYGNETAEAGLNIALVLGTEIEHVPEGMYRPEDDEWIDELEEALAVIDQYEGGPVLRREPRAARKLDWLRYYAIPSEDDIFRLTVLLTSNTAITEEEVAAAVAAFRSRTKRLTNLGDSAFRSPPDGDHGEAVPTGRDQRMGAAGGGSVQSDPVD